MGVLEAPTRIELVFKISVLIRTFESGLPDEALSLWRAYRSSSWRAALRGL
jgi:hypothetical protein